MSEWKDCILEDIAEIIPGFAFKSQHFSKNEGEAKVIKITDISPPFIDVNNAMFVDLQSYDRKKLEKYLIKKNDFVVAMTGATIGKVGRMRTEETAYINQRVATFRPRKNTIDDFLYYSISSSEFQAFIQNNIDSNSAQENISGTSIGRFPITLPPLPEQQAIASVLSSLDDKIDLLHRQNKTLEAMAEALFWQWFVEPCKDGLPEGWRVLPLGDLVTVKRGGSPRPIQDYLSETGLRWLKISDATKENSPYIFEIREHIHESGLNNTTFLEKGALVLSNSATPGIPKILQVDSCIHDGWLHFPKSFFSKEFLYLLFKSIREELISHGNGSIFTNLKTDILKDYKLPIPEKNELMVFQISVDLIFEKILQNAKQIRILEKQRDSLLPKLMSGEVRVSL